METKDLFKASYENPNEAQARLSKYGYKLDPELSKDNTKVFVGEDNKPVILHRGTTLGKGLKTAIQDIKTDITLGLGKTPKRLTEAKRLTKAVEAKYGQPSTAYGTSMGGYLAEKAGSKNAVTYNKAVAPQDLGKKIKKTQKDYRSNLDIVSVGALTQRGARLKNIKTKLTDPLTAHSLASFKI